MKRLFLLITLIGLTILGYTDIYADTYFTYHECSSVENVECENGNVKKSHKIVTRSLGIGNVRKDYYTLNTFFDADKTVTKVNLWAKKAINDDNSGVCGDGLGISYSLCTPVVKIEDNAFKDCTNLVEFSVRPEYRNNVNSMAVLVGKNAFENCVSLEGIRFPQNSISHQYTFEENPKVVTYVTIIGEYAFKNCTNLKYVIIDGKDTVIEENAFYGCPDVIIYCKSGSLAEEYAKANNLQYVLIDIEVSELEKAIFDYNLYLPENSKLIDYGLFDVYAYYYELENSSPNLKICSDYDLLIADWLQRGLPQGIQGSRVFDAKYYLDANGDLKKAYGDDYVAAYNHFIKYGCNELRKSSAQYCGSAYKNRYADLANMTGEELVRHYVTYGLAENRNARVTPVGGKYGDVDGDGVISANDSAMLLQKTLKSTFNLDVDEAYADVDGDGAVTANDALLVMQKVLNSSFVMPAS